MLSAFICSAFISSSICWIFSLGRVSGSVSCTLGCWIFLAFTSRSIFGIGMLMPLKGSGSRFGKE